MIASDDSIESYINNLKELGLMHVCHFLLTCDDADLKGTRDSILRCAFEWGVFMGIEKPVDEPMEVRADLYRKYEQENRGAD